MKTCKHCGKEFASTHKAQIYCTPACRNAHKTVVLRELRRANAGERVCRYCKKPFDPEHLQARYCSKECRNKGAEEGRKKRYSTFFVSCKHCKAKFSPRSKFHVFCSEECRTKHRAETAIESAQKKPIDPYFLRRGPTRANNRGYSSFFSGGEL